MMRAVGGLVVSIGLCQCLLGQTAAPTAKPVVNRNTGAVALRDAPLSERVRKDIAAVIEGGLTDAVSAGDPSAHEIALNSWVSFPRLAQNGRSVILVTGGMGNPDNGATGNVDAWLFRRVGVHAVMILDGGGFSVMPASKIYHHGMLDVQTSWNMSCCEGSVEVYRFNGTRYRPAYCYAYTVDDDEFKEGPHKKCEN